jgi:hypothetical protein
MTVDNAAGVAVRADINLALKALASQSGGASAPSTTFPSQMWADTGTGRLKRRDSANTLWLDCGALDTPVFDRGSNTNGEYIKFADGTLICWRLAAFSIAVTTASGGIFCSSSTIAGLAFAAPFIAKPTVKTSAVTASGLGWLTQASEQTTTAGPLLFVVNPTSGTISGTLNQLAIGRWY